jgi:hypothetical protein
MRPLDWTITKDGRDFAHELEPWIDCDGKKWDETLHICSAIAALAKEHHKLAEEYCNRGLSKAEERRDAAIETEVSAHVARLSELTGEPLHAKFTGDPRGLTVRVVIPRAAPHYGNTWARDGEFGV